MKKIAITVILVITAVLSVFPATYGLSVAGGGSYVFQSMGYLDALMNKGFFPDQIVGTSMGSVVAYYMAGGYYPVQVYNMFSILDFSNFFEMSLPINGGIVNTAGFGDLLYYTTKIDSFDKFMVPVKFGAVNLNKFDSEYINKGDPIRAVRAAVAIEGLFEPLKIGNCYYADIGIRDVNVVYPKSQFTTEKTVSIRFDSPKPDFTGMNFSNIINVLYTSVRMGSYVSNSLYASDKLDYDVSWILAEPAFDLKFFTNGIDLYKTGNDLGLKYLKDNPKFFENNKLTKKTVQTKVIDVYDVYAKVSNESYYRPREFYSTLRMNPGTGRDWHVLDSYIYAEIMNSRFYGGIKWDLFTMKLYPYIRMKQYYLPFESNRLDIQMVMEDYFSTVLRTYIMEGFRRNIYIDASYKFDFVQRKNMFEAAIGYDGMFKTFKNEDGIKAQAAVRTNMQTNDYKLELTGVLDLNDKWFKTTLGYIENSDGFFDFTEMMDFGSCSQKVYMRNRLKIGVLDNLNASISQIFLLSKIYLNFDFAISYDDWKDLHYVTGGSLQFPFKFAGVSDMGVEAGAYYNEAFNFYINFSDIY